MAGMFMTGDLATDLRIGLLRAKLKTEEDQRKRHAIKEQLCALLGDLKNCYLDSKEKGN